MTDIKMPQLGESIVEGTIGQWLVEVGGYVGEDQPLVQVTTDKADIDIPSPVSGVLTEVLAAEGTTVDVGALIAHIDETAAAAAGKAEKPKPAVKEEQSKAAPPPAPAEKQAEKPAPPQAKQKEPTPAAPPAERATVTIENVFRADEARQVPMSEAGKPKPDKATMSPAEPSITEEGIPGEEAMPCREPEEQLTPPPEIAPGEVPCGDEMAGFYSPAVLKLALTHGIDLKNIEGTGRCGRITKKDVMDAVEALKAGGKPAAPPAPPVPEAREAPSPRPPAAPETAGPLPEAGFGTYRPPVYEPEEGDELEPFGRLRQLIADHMVYSKATSPHVSTFAEVDMEHIVGLRGKIKEEFKSEVGVGLTYLHFIIMAAIMALKEFPVMNSVVQDGKILKKKKVHMGVAVDTERGLFVPVIRDAGSMDMKGIARAVDDLAVRVRERKAGPDELKGGTFTVSNPGRKGNLFGTPIISQPQAGILRMGEIVKRPVVVEVEGEDAIVVHPMMFLSLSYDHRVVDGLTANEFLHRVREILELGDFQV